MRIGVRLLFSALILTLSVPAALVYAAPPVESLSVSLQASEIAGVVDHTLTVSALSDGSPDSTYTGTVRFTSTDTRTGVILPGDYTFTGSGGDLGTATFDVTLVTAGSQTVTATDTSDGTITGSGTTIVSPAPAASLALTQDTSDLTSGASRSIVATVTDGFGNPVPGETVDLAKTAGTGSVSGLPSSPITNGSGVASHSVTGTTAGPVTITASDGILSNTLGFTVVASSAATLNLTGLTTSLTSGGTRDMTATVTDSHGNPVSGESVTFTKSAGTGAVSGLTTVSTNGLGVATDTVTGTTAGPVTITATDGALSDTLSFTVVASAAATVVLGGSTSSLASGATRTVTATVTDGDGNPVAGDTVVFSQSAGSGSVTGLGSAVTGSAGTASRTVTGDAVGSVTIKAADGAIFDTLTFSVVAGALNHIVVTPATASIDPGSQSYTTTAFDAAGNTTDVTGTAVLTISGGGSCSATSCSATARGAHTVTSTYLGKTSTATLTILNVAPVATDHTPTVLENAPSTAIDVLAGTTPTPTGMC